MKYESKRIAKILRMSRIARKLGKEESFAQNTKANHNARIGFQCLADCEYILKNFS